jgi:hypothetical protein
LQAPEVYGDTEGQRSDRSARSRAVRANRLDLLTGKPVATCRVQRLVDRRLAANQPPRHMDP